MTTEIYTIDGRFNNAPAFAEGWGLLAGLHGRHARIERLDFGPTGAGAPLFVSDQEAYEHVRQRALAGSPYHYEALRVHRETEQRFGRAA